MRRRPRRSTLLPSTTLFRSSRPVPTTRRSAPRRCAPAGSRTSPGASRAWSSCSARRSPSRPGRSPRDVVRTRTPGSATLVRLVAAREVSSRIRDKNFVISSVVILLLLLGTMAFQVVVSSGEETRRVAVVADDGRIGPAVEAQGEAVGVDVEVVDVPDEAAARDAVEAEEVDAALVGGTGPAPELLLVDRAPTLEAVVGGAVSGVAGSDRVLDRKSVGAGEGGGYRWVPC